MLKQNFKHGPSGGSRCGRVSIEEDVPITAVHPREAMPA
jgi:hypothetical protein